MIDLGEGRTGLLGGTFDPPHYGHLALAAEASYLYGLQRVILIPSRQPPHKAGGAVAAFEQRMAMVGLAAAGNPRLRVIDLEGQAGTSYSAGLLEWLDAPRELTWFIIGMDSLIELETWRRPERVLDLATVVAGTRPGYDPGDAPAWAREGVSVFDTPGLWISSSDLRDRFARGRPTAYLTPGQVCSYIRREGIYGTGR
jgi:nicotinate-nucleotide adenylyltransferase